MKPTFHLNIKPPNTGPKKVLILNLDNMSKHALFVQKTLFRLFLKDFSYRPLRNEVYGSENGHP